MSVALGVAAPEAVAALPGAPSAGVSALAAALASRDKRLRASALASPLAALLGAVDATRLA